VKPVGAGERESGRAGERESGRKNPSNDETVFKILYLGIRNVAKKWTMPIRDWRRAFKSATE
jgi:transposase-like protein